MKKMTNSMKIKKGDTVKVLYGKDRGRRGPVVAVDPKTRKVIVEGLNLYKKHIKGDGRTRTSEILTIEKPFPVSKVMLVCPHCDKATRVGVKKEGKDKIRICKKCGKDIIKDETKETKSKKEDKEEEKKSKKETKKKTSKTSKKKTTESKKLLRKQLNQKVKNNKNSNG
jgi:large subunit ribosomal protein L24